MTPRTKATLATLAAALLVALGCASGKSSGPSGGSAAGTPSADGGPVALLPPRLDLPAPLMQALKARQSTRDFSARPLELQILSDLLWAADGVNRADSGKRTAPTAMNRQDLDVYAATADGLFLYDPKAHALVPVLKKDIRALTGKQGFVDDAPLDLIYVSDLGKVPGDRDEQLVYAGAHAGFVSQNVYLFCAAAGLATVVRGYVDKEKLAAAMQLPPGRLILLAQTVGYPGDAPADAGE
jgi:nitroreductase